MSERIDHVAGARVWIDNAIRAQAHESSEVVAGVYASIANAEATLALVEQQRIANLIALFTATGSEAISRDGVRRIASSAYEQLMEPDVKEALGL